MTETLTLDELREITKAHRDEMNCIETELTQGTVRKLHNRPWTEEEKGPCLKAYEASLKKQPATLADIVQDVLNRWNGNAYTK